MHQAQWSPERPLPPPVSLASQSHHEKPPEVTCTSRGNPGFPASTRESPRETSFNTSRGQIPLPWLGSNDALPLATRMETRLPRSPTRGSLTSPSYLVRNRTLGPPLENHPETPPSPLRRWRTECANTAELVPDYAALHPGYRPSTSSITDATRTRGASPARGSRMAYVHSA